MQPAIEEKSEVLEVAALYTPEDERRVLRKIHCYVLPLMRIVFFHAGQCTRLKTIKDFADFVQYLEKQRLSYTSVSFSSSHLHIFGLLTDLNLASTQYS